MRGASPEREDNRIDASRLGAHHRRLERLRVTAELPWPAFLKQLAVRTAIVFAVIAAALLLLSLFAK